MTEEYDLTELSPERRASDIKLSAIEKKLDEHSVVLSNIRDTLAQIAVQNERISSIQAMQAEMRGDINELEKRYGTIMSFQASCPRKSLNTLWLVILGSVASMAATFMIHVLGGGK